MRPGSLLLGLCLQVLLGILVLPCKKIFAVGSCQSQRVSTRHQVDEQGTFSSSALTAGCLMPLLLAQPDEGRMIVDKV